MTREQAYAATANGEPSHESILTAFHDCWGNAKDGEYNKEAWQALQYLLNKKGILV